MHRRRLLETAALVVFGAGAGCLGRGRGDGIDGDDAPSDVPYVRSEYAPELLTDRPDPPYALLVETAAHAETVFDPVYQDTEAYTSIRSFLDETDYDRHRLLFLELPVPQPNYRLTIEGIAIEGDRLTVAVEPERMETDEAVPAVEVDARALGRIDLTDVDGIGAVEATVTHRDEAYEAIRSSELLE